MTEEERKDLFEQPQEENEVALFNDKNELAHNISWLMAHYIKEIKRIEDEQSKFYGRLKAEMEARGIKKIETEHLTITYVEPTTRDLFDSKLLKADNPELYAQYLKPSEVKSSVRIKTK